MKHKIGAILLLIAFVICSSVVSSDARIFDRIIAYVNDDVITKRRLDVLVKQQAFELQQIHRYSESEAINEAEKQRGELLDRLIRQMLLLEAALTLKVQVTDIDIEEQIQKFKSLYQIPSDEEFKRLLNRDGLTLVAFREQIQRNLMTEKLVMGRILPRLQVRDSDVQKFFEENRDQLPTKADRVHLRQIFIAYKPSDADKKTANETVTQAIEEIRTDKTKYEEIAQRISSEQNPGTQVGMLIETTPAEILTLPDAFLTVLAKLKAGEISEVIETDDGFHVFMVETRTDEKVAFRHLTVPFTFNDQAKQIASEKAAEIYKKLEDGKQFADLAKELSDDEKTREKGGDLGTHVLTELHSKTRDAINNIEEDKYTKPIDTDTGILIFMVDERITPELTPQEKQQIIGILRQQLFEKEWTAYTDTLMENAYIKIKSDATPTAATPKTTDNNKDN